MAKYKLGLVSMRMGDIAGDGGMGTDLAAIGDTVAGTAKMSTTAAQTTDFKIEESDSPILSIKSEADKIDITWSTYNNSADTLVKMFGGTKVAGAAGAINVFGAITAGSSYAVGTYQDVPLTGGTGTGATADIEVTAGGVTKVTKVNPGQGYTAADSLSASDDDLGAGGGSGFAIVVTSVATGGEQWKAPDAIPTIEQSLRVEWKQGGYIEIPRAQINAALNMTFNKTALSQIDVTASILQPTKAGVPRMTIHADV